jgi:glucokinase
VIDCAEHTSQYGVTTVGQTSKTNSTERSGPLSVIVAADLGGTHLRVAAVDEEGRVRDRIKQQTPKGDRADEILRAVVEGAHKLEARLDAGLQIKAVSVVVPGTVQTADGIVMKAPNLPCLDGFRLGAALESELRWPAMLENDANAAAMGEMWRGAGRGYKSVICVTLGTGVGGGIIVDGKLLRGIDGSAGEIGHIGVEPLGDPCGCGSRGCLEVYSSATAIVRQTRDLRPRFPDSPLHTVESLTAEKIYQAGLAGDELALEVFRRMGFYLGVGLASLVNVFNPEAIVIGGGVAAGWELFQTQIMETIHARAFPVPARRAKIVRAEKGDDAGLLGAAHLAFTSS